jgi:hypothetical protein
VNIFDCYKCRHGARSHLFSLLLAIHVRCKGFSSLCYSRFFIQSHLSHSITFNHTLPSFRMATFVPTDDLHFLPRDLVWQMQATPEAVWGANIGCFLRDSNASTPPFTPSSSPSTYLLPLPLPVPLPLNLTVTISARDLARNAAIAAGIESSRDPGIITIYSDAALSSDKTLAGAACVWQVAGSATHNSPSSTSKNSEWFSYSEHLFNQRDVASAETMGVIFGLRAALPLALRARELSQEADSQGPAGSREILVRVFTDSQDCLRQVG